jgi:FtsP/CotA-like multicopper oxidase with cupredoxin domain
MNRRTFVKGLAMGGVVATVDRSRGAAWAQPPALQPPAVLSGSTFDLRIGESLVDFTGAPSVAHTINGSLPGPTLRWKEGDTVTLRVANALRDDTCTR